MRKVSVTLAWAAFAAGLYLGVASLVTAFSDPSLTHTQVFLKVLGLG